MKIITSSKNPLFQHLVLLSKDATYRKETNSLLIEGKKIILEALSKHTVKQLLIPQGADPLHSSLYTEILPELSQKISSLKTCDGYLAEIEKPKNASLENCQCLLILDQLQDPGNLGALLRSAFAFNFDGIFIVQPSVDPYSPKVTRASMGANLHLLIQIGSYKELEQLLELRNYQVLLAEASGTAMQKIPLQKPLALILGNEAHGSALKYNAKYLKVAIPIQNIDSLNVAIAGSLLMYQMQESLCT